MTAEPVEPATVHSGCVVCGGANARGLRLRFALGDGKGVEAILDCEASLEGYGGRLHGGVIAAALDGVMTHCLFAQGLTAVTAELVVKYKHPVAIGRPARVRAWLARDLGPLYRLLHGRAAERAARHGPHRVLLACEVNDRLPARRDRAMVSAS